MSQKEIDSVAIQKVMVGQDKGGQENKTPKLLRCPQQKEVVTSNQTNRPLWENTRKQKTI